MAIKFFWMFIGSFMAGSIAMFMIAKRLATPFASAGSKPVISSLIFGVVLSGATYLATYISKHLFTVFWILAGLFFIFGCIFILIFHHKYFQAKKKEQVHKTGLGELIFCLCILFFMIVIFAALQYFPGENKDFLYYPIMLSALAFFVPLAFMHTYDAVVKIPEPVYHSWAYPINEPIELPDETPGEKLYVIAFEIKKKLHDNQLTNFRAKAPEHMKLGELYYHFINDYNEQKSETTIDFLDSKQFPCEWWFHLKPKWYQRNKILNPFLTVKENSIKENSIIICERFNTIGELS